MASGIQFIYSDHDLFLVNKPCLIHTTENPNSKSNSVAAQLLTQYPELTGVSEKQADAGLVNRLDFETSGLLLGAWNKEAWLMLRHKQQEGLIIKSYLALVEGNFSKTLTAETLLGSEYRRGKKVHTAPLNQAPKARFKQAKTDFIPLSNHAESALEQGISIVEARLYSGMRHQVRAHAAWLKHPLAGDKLYGSKVVLNQLINQDTESAQSNLPNWLLHAWKIEIRLSEKSTLKFEAPWPWQKLLGAIKLQ